MDWVLACVLLYIVAQLGIAFWFSHRNRNAPAVNEGGLGYVITLSPNVIHLKKGRRRGLHYDGNHTAHCLRKAYQYAAE